MIRLMGVFLPAGGGVGRPRRGVSHRLVRPESDRLRLPDPVRAVGRSRSSDSMPAGKDVILPGRDPATAEFSPRNIDSKPAPTRPPSAAGWQWIGAQRVRRARPVTLPVVIADSLTRYGMRRITCDVMPASTLLRLSGLALMAALALIVGGLLHPQSESLVDVAGSTTTASHGLFAIAFALILLGLPGLYAVLADRTGVLGLAGFVLMMLFAVYHVYCCSTRPGLMAAMADDPAADRLFAPGAWSGRERSARGSARSGSWLRSSWGLRWCAPEPDHAGPAGRSLPSSLPSLLRQLSVPPCQSRLERPSSTCGSRQSRSR